MPGNSARKSHGTKDTTRQRALRPVEAGPGVLVHTTADRRLATEHWLLAAHPSPEQARKEWGQRGGVALLPLGTLFSAVRIPRELVLSAANVEESGDYLVDVMVDHFLFEALHGAPVICDLHQARYYALVPASMPAKWHKAAADWRALGVDCLGRGTLLGVPNVKAKKPDATKWASYWAVAMDSPGELCEPLAVARLIAAGQRRMAQECEA
jgi:hypothetical protein